MQESAERLKELVDECPAERIIFFAHNGPTGLGEDRSDIWGCDFRPAGGDFGDPDLRIAIDHARTPDPRRSSRWSRGTCTTRWPEAASVAGSWSGKACCT